MLKHHGFYWWWTIMVFQCLFLLEHTQLIRILLVVNNQYLVFSLLVTTIKNINLPTQEPEMIYNLNIYVLKQKGHNRL